MGRLFPAHTHFFVRVYGQTFAVCHHQFLLEIIANIFNDPIYF
jgi:hypothetical protein